LFFGLAAANIQRLALETSSYVGNWKPTPRSPASTRPTGHDSPARA
jgi:hypothetical protein